MSRDIPEADWKVFRQLHPVALERFCERVLSETARLTRETGKSSYERYLALFKLIGKRDGEIAACFDDMRRSTAVRQLVAIQSRGLLTDEEFARFSSETRATLQSLLKLDRT
jgi:hypothetical protein